MSEFDPSQQENHDCPQHEHAPIAEHLEALRSGRIIIGYVEQANGPGAQEAPFPLSQHEAKVIAAYWIQEIIAVRATWHFHKMSGSYEIRIEPYAFGRLNKLIDAGYIDNTEVEAMLEEAAEVAGLNETAPEHECGDPVPERNADGLVEWCNI